MSQECFLRWRCDRSGSRWQRTQTRATVIPLTPTAIGARYAASRNAQALPTGTDRLWTFCTEDYMALAASAFARPSSPPPALTVVAVNEETEEPSDEELTAIDLYVRET